jgi:hypothetical protein
MGFSSSSPSPAEEDGFGIENISAKTSECSDKTAVLTRNRVSSTSMLISSAIERSNEDLLGGQ